MYSQITVDSTTTRPSCASTGTWPSGLIRRNQAEYCAQRRPRHEDVRATAGQGFVKLINNRPDVEVPGQPTAAAIEAAARAAGLDYVHIPFAGRPTAEHAAAVVAAAEAAPGPVLAFCRSG